MQPLRVYLSSTTQDLKDHRDSVSLALASSGLSVARMEDHVASDQRPLDMCLKDVAQCDVFVGIYAWRYGYEPPAAHGNPDGCSITHLAYQQAELSGLRKLLFFAHPDTRPHWPEAFRDDLTGQGEHGEKLARFRQTVGTERTISFFRSQDELATLVLAAILRSAWAAGRCCLTWPRRGCARNTSADPAVPLKQSARAASRPRGRPAGAFAATGVLDMGYLPGQPVQHRQPPTQGPADRQGCLTARPTPPLPLQELR